MDNGISVDKMNENNYLHNIEDENKVAWKTVTFFFFFNLTMLVTVLEI